MNEPKYKASKWVKTILVICFFVVCLIPLCAFLFANNRDVFTFVLVIFSPIFVVGLVALFQVFSSYFMINESEVVYKYGWKIIEIRTEDIKSVSFNPISRLIVIDVGKKIKIVILAIFEKQTEILSKLKGLGNITINEQKNLK